MPGYLSILAQIEAENETHSPMVERGQELEDLGEKVEDLLRRTEEIKNILEESTLQSGAEEFHAILGLQGTILANLAFLGPLIKKITNIQLDQIAESRGRNPGNND